MKLTTIGPVKLLCILLLIATNVQALEWYGWVMPRESQAASVSQKIGVTDITVSYHRPEVKDRRRDMPKMSTKRLDDLIEELQRKVN